MIIMAAVGIVMGLPMPGAVNRIDYERIRKARMGEDEISDRKFAWDGGFVTGLTVGIIFGMVIMALAVMV